MAAPETPAELCARLREIAEDGDTSDVYGNRVMRAVALIETLTSPAATPVSEGDMRAFGASEHAAYKWPDDTPEHQAARAAFCEGAALAKPASSPAGGEVRERALAAVEKLANTNISMSLSEWNEVSGAILAALSPSTSGGRVGE